MLNNEQDWRNGMRVKFLSRMVSCRDLFSFYKSTVISVDTDFML
jgi:hypothetical protein